MQNSEINWRFLTIALIVILLLAGIAGKADLEDATLAEQAYCENVKTYIETGGKNGWPDYREMYEVMCIKK